MINNAKSTTIILIISLFIMFTFSLILYYSIMNKGNMSKRGSKKETVGDSWRQTGTLGRAKVEC